MTTIAINLPDDRLQRLRETAGRFGITIEDLVRAGIEQLLSQPDETFQNAADYVLKKNAELYRRLA
ncbi:MAG: DNA-binding protein [Acidobacteria bacterium]|nr:MAG: DNA-binding protein [Acidobacteriota bacterium]